MSAFVVDNTHIDLLVHVAFDGPKDTRWLHHAPYFKGSPLGFTTRDKVGAALLAENERSVNFRYAHNAAFCGYNDAQSYTYTDPQHNLTIPEALKAINCLEYQSCEHPEWEESDACKFLEALRAALCRAMVGYEEAPWDWSKATITEQRNLEASRHAKIKAAIKAGLYQVQ
jgi:hypothetical protein